MENLKIIEFWKTGENPITCYNSRPFEVPEEPKPPRKKESFAYGKRKEVIVVDKDGNSTPYETVAKVSEVLDISISKLHSIIKGRSKNKTEYQFFHSTLNS